MGIEGQSIAETGQDRLAPRRNLADCLTLQLACIWFQVIKGEEYICHALAGNGRGKRVSCTTYFRSFRQGRLSQTWVGIFGFFHLILIVPIL